VKRLLVVCALALLTSACDDGARYARASCALVDTSGTYADEQETVTKIIKKSLLAHMLPGDSLILVRIDSDSYSKKNVEAMITLDRRPSRANAQKLEFSRLLDKLASRRHRARHTDITGALMLCGEYLAETKAGTHTVLLFSDMLEDLPRGVTRSLGPNDLAGANVVAMNVKRLKADTADPARFRSRLSSWKKRVTHGGAAQWRVIHDPTQLLSYLQLPR